MVNALWIDPELVWRGHSCPRNLTRSKQWIPSQALPARSQGSKAVVESQPSFALPAFCGQECPRHMNSLSPALLLDLNIQAADFLVQRRKRDVKMLRGFRLVPVAAFQHVGDDAPLDVFDNFEE